MGPMSQLATKPIRKAVIAAAGFGTRFLPQTKAMPKEMLPIVDKPIIQYVVEELVDAGIEDIIIVTGYSKRSIEDHFDSPSQDLISNLELGGESKATLLHEVRSIADLANFVYVRQKGPYGNAAPLMSVEHLIGDEPFIFSWGDDFVRANPSRFKQLIAVYQQHRATVLTCVPAKSDQDYKRYGFVGGEQINPSLMLVKNIIEKPGSKEKAPSNYATVSSYLFTPELFSYLHQAKKRLTAGEEFIIQPCLQKMIENGHKIYGCQVINGKYYDSGNKIEYLKTVANFALEHKGIGPAFAVYLKARLKEMK